MKKSTQDRANLLGHVVSISEALSQLIQVGFFGSDIVAMNKAKAASNMVIEYIRLAINSGTDSIESLVVPDSIRIKIENNARKAESKLGELDIIPESWKSIANSRKGGSEVLDNALINATKAANDFIHGRDVQKPNVEVSRLDSENPVEVEVFLDETEKKINQMVEANLIAAYAAGRIPKL